MVSYYPDRRFIELHCVLFIVLSNSLCFLKRRSRADEIFKNDLSSVDCQEAKKGRKIRWNHKNSLLFIKRRPSSPTSKFWSKLERRREPRIELET